MGKVKILNGLSAIRGLLSAIYFGVSAINRLLSAIYLTLSAIPSNSKKQ
ncbi:hypothetical protein ACIQ1H_15550 [Lysinibacillus sp. NPDC097279]